MTRAGEKTNSKEVNNYERGKSIRVQANKEKMASLGIKHIVNSLTSLCESTKEKKRKGRSKVTQDDDEYDPAEDQVDEECEEESTISTRKEKNGGKCSRLDVMIESRTRKSKKSVNADTLAKNTHVVDEMKKLKEQREQGLHEKTDEQIFLDVLGKDTHGYLRAYGPDKSITKHFRVKPSQIDLAQEVVETKKAAEKAVEEARKDAENARKEAKDARKEAEEARKDAESAKNEAEATRNEVDRNIAANNKVWEERFKQILQTIGLNTSNNNDSSSDGSSC